MELASSHSGNRTRIGERATRDWNWAARGLGEGHWLARDQGTAPRHTDLAIFGETVLYWYRLYGTDLVTFRETVLQLSRLDDPYTD